MPFIGKEIYAFEMIVCTFSGDAWKFYFIYYYIPSAKHTMTTQVIVLDYYLSHTYYPLIK